MVEWPGQNVGDRKLFLFHIKEYKTDEQRHWPYIWDPMIMRIKWSNVDRRNSVGTIWDVKSDPEEKSWIKMHTHDKSDEMNQRELLRQLNGDVMYQTSTNAPCWTTEEIKLVETALDDVGMLPVKMGKIPDQFVWKECVFLINKISHVLQKNFLFDKLIINKK